MIAKVAVSAANFTIDRPYDYLVPEQYLNAALPGMRVMVPFGKGNRVTEGIVLSTAEESSVLHCKEIIRPLDPEPMLSPEQVRLALFMRDRYFCTVYDAARAMLPSGFRLDSSGKPKARDKFREMVRLSVSMEEALLFLESRKTRAPKQAEMVDLLLSFEVLPARDLLQHTGASRQVLKKLQELGIVECYQQEVLRRPEYDPAQDQTLPVLNEEQRIILDQILMQWNMGQPGDTALLCGVTGSGKTSVYAHLIQTALHDGRGGILLVPEIALTPQMLSLFSGWFGNRVAVLHSGLSLGERYDEWKRIRRGEATLVVGTRSAVFAPVHRLGLIIMDEEQEDSYASEAVPRYHARDVARFRCHQERAFLLLGSATPDIGSRYLAERGEYHYFRLLHRYNEKPLPSVRIVDMKQELLSGNTSNLSAPLKDAILERLERKEQSILFLNRRGTSKLVTCTTCGYIYRCPHCSVSMTWHASRRRMICHYCGTGTRLDTKCPSCGGKLSFFGAGTQMIEEELRTAFPGTEILRVDADTVNPAGSHRALFQKFIHDEIPIMVGTQMIAKGLNFDRVTLVGVLSADQGLYSNDYRAGEKTFSLLTQVIGRGGRSNQPGEALIQTFTPDNEIIKLAAEQDYESFYRAEIEMRRLQNAPPFSHWLGLFALGKEEEQVLDALQTCKVMLNALILQESETAEVFGPVPLPVVKVSDRYRYRLQIRCNMNKSIRRILATILSACNKNPKMKKISFYVENDAG